MTQEERAERGRQFLGQAYKELGTFQWPNGSTAEARDQALIEAQLLAEQAIQVISELRATRRHAHRSTLDGKE